MIGTPQEMRALNFELGTSAWTLGAIGALFASGLVDRLREPRSVDDLAPHGRGLSKSRIERCLAVSAAAGFVLVEASHYRLAPGAMPFLQQPMRAAIEGDIRSTLMQSLALMDSANAEVPSAGWNHTSAALLQAQGDASGGFPPMLKANIVPTLGDLAARLERPGARFLDVGVGVAALSISMCRAWPELHVVGLDPFDVPLGIARENVARAGLGERIDLRRIGAQDLRDEASFDLAWLPAFFIPAQSLPAAVERVHASLRPGGWMLVPVVVGPGGSDRDRAVLTLLNDLWGGGQLSLAEAEALFKNAGFTAIRTISGPPGAPVLVLGQR